MTRRNHDEDAPTEPLAPPPPGPTARELITRAIKELRAEENPDTLAIDHLIFAESRLANAEAVAQVESNPE